MLTQSGDLKVVFNPFEGWDFVLNETNTDLETTADLSSAVFFSLFVKGRAKDGDVAEGESKGGWWGNSEIENVFTSRLWVLFQNKIDRTTVGKVEEYAKAALAWMIEAEVVDTIEVSASRPKANRIDWKVTLFKDRTKLKNYKFLANWEASRGLRAEIATA